MAGPFGWVTPEARRPLLWTLTALAISSSAWLFSLDRALVNDVATNGIVSFELARTLERSDAILRSWSPDARATALLIQGFDYLYLLLYPAWLSLAAGRLGVRLGGAWRPAGAVTAWLVLLAAPLDAVENYALIEQLLHGADAWHAGLAWGCAVPKFALIASTTVDMDSGKPCCC